MMKRKNKRKYEEGGGVGGSMQVRTRLNTMPRVDEIPESSSIFNMLGPLAGMALQHPLAPHNMMGGMMMQDGGEASRAEKEKRYYELREQHKELRGAIGSNDKELLLKLQKEHGHNNNLSALFGEAMDLKNELYGWGLDRHELLNFPHIGQQIKGVFTSGYDAISDATGLNKESWNRFSDAVTNIREEEALNNTYIKPRHYANGGGIPGPHNMLMGMMMGGQGFGQNREVQRTMEEIARLDYNDALQQADSDRTSGIPFFGYGDRKTHIAEGPRGNTDPFQDLENMRAHTYRHVIPRNNRGNMGMLGAMMGMPMMANGGEVPDEYLTGATSDSDITIPGSSPVDINAESQEFIETPEGEGFKIPGNVSHENKSLRPEGGVNMTVPENSFIYPKGKWTRKKERRERKAEKLYKELEKLGKADGLLEDNYKRNSILQKLKNLQLEDESDRYEITKIKEAKEAQGADSQGFQDGGEAEKGEKIAKLIEEAWDNTDKTGYSKTEVDKGEAAREFADALNAIFKRENISLIVDPQGTEIDIHDNAKGEVRRVPLPIEADGKIRGIAGDVATLGKAWWEGRGDGFLPFVGAKENIKRQLNQRLQTRKEFDANLSNAITSIQDLYINDIPESDFISPGPPDLRSGPEPNPWDRLDPTRRPLDATDESGRGSVLMGPPVPPDSTSTTTSTTAEEEEEEDPYKVTGFGKDVDDLASKIGKEGKEEGEEFDSGDYLERAKRIGADYINNQSQLLELMFPGGPERKFPNYWQGIQNKSLADLDKMTAIIDQQDKIAKQDANIDFATMKDMIADYNPQRQSSKFAGLFNAKRNQDRKQYLESLNQRGKILKDKAAYNFKGNTLTAKGADEALKLEDEWRAAYGEAYGGLNKFIHDTDASNLKAAKDLELEAMKFNSLNDAFGFQTDNQGNLTMKKNKPMDTAKNGGPIRRKYKRGSVVKKMHDNRASNPSPNSTSNRDPYFWGALAKVAAPIVGNLLGGVLGGGDDDKDKDGGLLGGLDLGSLIGGLFEHGGHTNRYGNGGFGNLSFGGAGSAIGGGGFPKPPGFGGGGGNGFPMPFGFGGGQGGFGGGQGFGSGFPRTGANYNLPMPTGQGGQGGGGFNPMSLLMPHTLLTGSGGLPGMRNGGMANGRRSYGLGDDVSLGGSSMLSDVAGGLSGFTGCKDGSCFPTGGGGSKERDWVDIIFGGGSGGGDTDGFEIDRPTAPTCAMEECPEKWENYYKLLAMWQKLQRKPQGGNQGGLLGTILGGRGQGQGNRGGFNPLDPLGLMGGMMGMGQRGGMGMYPGMYGGRGSGLAQKQHMTNYLNSRNPGGNFYFG